MKRSKKIKQKHLDNHLRFCYNKKSYIAPVFHMLSIKKYSWDVAQLVACDVGSVQAVPVFSFSKSPKSLVNIELFACCVFLNYNKKVV